MQIKPKRVTPRTPKQARPLPPPPIPNHAADDLFTSSRLTTSPPVPIRSKSLVDGFLAAGEELGLSDSIFVCSSGWALTFSLFPVKIQYFSIYCFSTEEEISEEEPLLSNCVLSSAISHVVRKRLFNAEASPMDKFIARSPTRGEIIVKQSATHENAAALPSSAVTTPDSGCETAEDEPCRAVSSLENCAAPVSIPKLDLHFVSQEEPTVDPAQIVPPLDLSEIAPHDDDHHRGSPTKKQYPVPSKPHRKSSSQQVNCLTILALCSILL